MADYSNLQAAIDAGTTNMTAIRNNSKNDDGVDTITTGITWFNFNSVVVANLYASGNSWIGIGSSTEHLKVNRRDGASWYVWTEVGIINGHKFYKVRWTGYSYYSASSDDYAQAFDMFLVDNGQIFLNFYDVPTSNFDGINALVCGSETVSYTPTKGVACEWTFTPTDASKGTGWSVKEGRPDIFVPHKMSGSAIYTISGITGTAINSLIGWEESKPEGTTLKVSVSTDGTTFVPVSNGGSFLPGGTYENKTVYVKVEMSTTDAQLTPVLSNLHFYLQTAEDRYNLILEMEPLQRFESSAGNITVAYNGGGTLIGEGGAVLAFTQTFTPVGLTPKPHQNDAEHIEISSVAVTGTLTKINYTNTAAQDQGHIEIASVTATGTLTNVNNI